MGFLMLPHLLTNFEIQKYYQKERRFNSVVSRNTLPKKIKDGAYMIDLDKHIGLLYLVIKMKLFISIVLVLNMFLKKLKNLLEIKT